MNATPLEPLDAGEVLGSLRTTINDIIDRLNTIANLKLSPEGIGLITTSDNEQTIVLNTLSFNVVENGSLGVNTLVGVVVPQNPNPPKDD